MPEYKFVTSGGSFGGPQPTTKDIRSHAIRTALHRSLSEPENSRADQSENTVRRKAELKGRFRLPGAPGRKSSTKPRGRSPPGKGIGHGTEEDALAAAAQLQLLRAPPPGYSHELGSDLMDPFNSLSVPMNRSIDTLMKYFLTHFNLNLQASEFDRQRPWFPWALQSPMLIRATLALTAEYWTASAPAVNYDLQLEGYKQKGDAMRMVSAVLAAPKTHGRAQLDVFGLASIATLANGEAFQGHFLAADVHLKGLYDVIESMGGSRAVLQEYILGRCINWADIHVASGLGRVPIFPNFHPMSEVQVPDIVIRQASTPSLAHLNDLGGRDTADCADCQTIFMLLRQTVWAQDTATLAADSMRILMYTAEKLILQNLYGQQPRPSTSGQRRITALVLAVQGFLYVALRRAPIKSPVVRNISSRLRLSLSQVLPVTRIWSGFYPALLWVSFAGVLVTSSLVDGSAREWFASTFVVACDKIQESHPSDPVDAAELHRLLEQYLWKDPYSQDILDELIKLKENRVDKNNTSSGAGTPEE